MNQQYLQQLSKNLDTLDQTEELHTVGGGYGRIPSRRVPPRNNRWDDVPFRIDGASNRVANFDTELTLDGLGQLSKSQSLRW